VRQRRNWYYQQLYHSAKPAHLMTPVLAHLEAVSGVLRRRPAAVERRQLFQNESCIGLLAGRIAFFDLHDPIAASATTTSHRRLHGRHTTRI
jgi:hypothetical protein